MFGRAGALLQNNPPKALRGQEEEPDYHFNLSLKHTTTYTMGFPGGSVVKSTLANAGDAKRRGSSNPGWVRSPDAGNGNPLQYSGSGNPMERGARRAIVQGVTKSWT